MILKVLYWDTVCKRNKENIHLHIFHFIIVKLFSKMKGTRRDLLDVNFENTVG